tara:strand:- start:542 stop:751 length:210 start_codon:yes stop_codon:yes gene_type:complete
MNKITEQDSQVAQQIYKAIESGQVTERQVYDAVESGEISEGAAMILNDGIDFSRFAADDFLKTYKNKIS